MESLATSWRPAHPAFVSLLDALAGEIDPVYIVGGVVRDALLGRAAGITDLDVIVTRAANVAAQRVADRLGWAYYPLDPVRDVARLVFTAGKTPLVCDLAAMRGGDLATDLQARDFTVNALAMRWRRGAARDLVDLGGGQSDLAARRLRRVTPWALAEDPVRLLRAVRLAVQLDFVIEEETLLQIQRISDTVRLASAERVRDELWKMLASAAPEHAIEMLRRLSLLRPLLPEVADLEGVPQTAPHAYDVFQHTQQCVHYAVKLRAWLTGAGALDDYPAGVVMTAALTPLLYRMRQALLTPVAAERRLIDWLPWVALLHDVGKPATRTADQFPDGAVRHRFLGHEEQGATLAGRRLEFLKFSRTEIEVVQGVVRAHMRPHWLHTSFGADPISRRACYRFFQDSEGRRTETQVGIGVALLALADYQATYAASPPPAWPAYVEHMAQLIEYGVGPQGRAAESAPLVDGHTLMAYFSLPPGKQVGALLEQLREAQAVGEITTAEDGLALAAELLTRRL